MSEIINIEIKADQSGADEALQQVNKSLKEGKEAAQALNHVLNGDLAGAFKSLGEMSKTLGVDLGLAFSPAEIIGFIQAIVDAIKNISDLIEQHKQVEKAIAGQTPAWEALQQSQEKFSETTKIKLLEIRERIDAITQGPLTVFKDKLALIDAQAFDQLKQQFKSLSDEATKAFAAMEEGRFQQIIFGTLGAQAGIKEVGDRFRLTMADIKAAEKSGNMDAIGAIIDRQIKKTNELIETYKHWAGTDQTPSILAANERLLTVLNDLKDSYSQITKVQKGEKDVVGADLAANELQKSIANNLAKIADDKRTADARIQLQRAAIQTMHQDKVISDEQALELNRSNIDAEFKQDEAALNAKIAQLNRDPSHNTKQIAAVQAEIKVLQAGHLAALAKLDSDYYREVEKNGQEAVHKAAERDNKVLANLRGAMEARMKAVKDENDKEVQLEQLAVQNNFNQGKISKQQEIAQLAELKVEELQIDINYLRNRQQLYQKGSKEYEQIEAQITKDKDDQVKLRIKADVDEANNFSAQIRRQLKSWQDLNQQLSQSFMQTMNNFNSSLTSFITTGQGNWKQFAASAIESILQIGLQYEESKLLMMIMDKLGAKTKLQMDAETGLAEIEIASDVGAANAYAAWADMPAVAAGMAAAAKGIISGFGVPIAALSAASSAGGDWQVDSDRLNFVHKDETILPAGIAGKLRNMVESGSPGSGVTVVVNHSVSAVDASSFQGHIRRHSNMIANEVTRALKRKGVR